VEKEEEKKKGSGSRVPELGDPKFLQPGAYKFS
jgi:hypothetical protein